MSEAERIWVVDRVEGRIAVLVADDDELRASLSDQLRLHEEFITSEASTAAEALETAKSEYFDAVILDVGLPDMDGREVCRLMRRNGLKSPIIMLTGQDTDADQILGLDAGANDYVTKPFDVKDIATRVHIAERMLENTQRAPRLDPHHLKEAGEPGAHDFALADPVHINGVEQLVLPFSLGNYLSQLSRQHLDICQVFAVKIEHIDELYATCNTREFARAALEAVCYQTRDLLEAMRGDWAGAGAADTVLRVDGGMVASDWTMQFLADILDAPVDRPNVLETTALGAAWLAGMQAGLYPDQEGFAREWALDRRFEPDMQPETRAAKYDSWKRAVAATMTV